MSGTHRASSSGQEDALAPIAAQWSSEGYAVLPGFYSDEEIEQAKAAVGQAWAERLPRLVVDDMVALKRLRLVDVDEHARAHHRFKTNDLYMEYEAVRRLGLNARLTPILTRLLGHVPVLCNSLSFEQGSAQDDHIDALFMTPRSPHQLVATWVALEDCHLDAGPLRYYPGSHRIPPYVFSTGSHHVVETEMPHWHAYVNHEVAARGLKPEVFAARKGDVFIWSAYLLHGGSPINDPARTRNSVVFHYYSEGDCVAQGCTLVPYEGGYWMHRPHQPVPGFGEPEAPPLPANARVTGMASA
nr:phytanoyl-CoA dioxygenase family protein [Luteimonas sp. Y-2-2-4F]